MRSSRAGDPFAAIGDPTRRRILESLRDRRTMTAGEVASLFPGISRAAVSKHLGVLRGARLVAAEERGREWLYRLDYERLAGIERWLQGFAPYWEETLRRLKERAEEPEAESTS